MDKNALETALKALDVWLIVFGVFVAVGVVGESIVGFVHFRKGAELQRLQAAENLAQERQIEFLKRDAESVRLDTANALARAASAEKQAEQDRLARVKIEEKLAPRRLSSEQIRTIADKLRAFSGQRLNFFATSGDSEIIGISEDVLRALTGPDSAAWKVTTSLGQDSRVIESGVIVEISTDADSSTAAAATALASALREQRLFVAGPHVPQAAGTMMGQINTDPDAKIRIIIAKKP